MIELTQVLGIIGGLVLFWTLGRTWALVTS